MFAVQLDLHHTDQAAYLEELFWTLDAVDSVTYHLHDAMTVIGSDPNLEQPILKLLQAEGLADSVTVKTAKEIPKEDWAESWKQYWHVSRVLPDLIIQPSWETYHPQSQQEIVLKLDPGSAFGTGTHDTTRLVLALMQEFLPVQSVLDVGCGSGILAIYAAKHGVPHVVAVDNDPLAVEVARVNASENGVDIQFLSETTGQFDLLTANILTHVLIEMMPQLVERTSANGILIFSGITQEQYAQMADCLKNYPVKIVRVVLKGDWIALVCRKNT